MISDYLYNTKLFQSSPSMQRETKQNMNRWPHWRNFNPLPLCRGRQGLQHHLKKSIRISILSLYAEGDRLRNRRGSCREAISILSLYAEGDFWLFLSGSCAGRKFQSSPSMQRETQQYADTIKSSNISILSLYAEGDMPLLMKRWVYRSISILSLYAEGDGSNFVLPSVPVKFQSSPSMQRETVCLFFMP